MTVTGNSTVPPEVIARAVATKAAYDDKAWADLEEAKRRERIRRAARAAIDAEEAAADLSVLPRPVSLTEAMAAPRESTKWRIEGLLPSGGNAILVALQKAGKTTLMGELVRSAVDGVPFLGAFDLRPLSGRVALLNYEMDAQMQTDWLADLGIKHPDRVVKLDFRGHRVPLLTERGVDWLAEQLRNVETELVIVDPFGAAYLSADGTEMDSNNDRVGQFLYALNKVKQRAGVGELIMPAHAKREIAQGTERARGPAILGDWPDATWVLGRDKQGGRYFRATEGRDVDVPEQRLMMDPQTRRLRLDGTARWVTQRDDLTRALLAWITKYPGHNKQDVESAMCAEGYKRDQVRAAIVRLTERGAVRVEKSARGAHLHYAAAASTPSPRGSIS